MMKLAVNVSWTTEKGKEEKETLYVTFSKNGTPYKNYVEKLVEALYNNYNTVIWVPGSNYLVVESKGNSASKFWYEQKVRDFLDSYYMMNGWVLDETLSEEDI